MASEPSGSKPTGPRSGEVRDPVEGSPFQLLDAVGQPVLVLDDEGRILDANEPFLELDPAPTEEIDEEPLEALFAPHARSDCRTAIELAAEGRQGEFQAMFHHEEAATRVDVTLRGIPEEDELLATIDPTSTDEAAREKLAAARDQIFYQKTLLESQNEASIDGILIVDENSRIVSYNQRFLELWGVEDDLIEIGRTDREALGSVLDQIVDQEKFLEKVEYLAENPDETIRDEVHLENGTVLERWSSPVVAEDGTHYGRGWYFRDITARKRVEEELQRHRDRLEELVEERTEELQQTAEKLQAEVEQRKAAEEELERRVAELARSNADLERFAYVASHDLQEPLRMVASYVQLIEKRYREKLDEEGEEYIDYAVEGATRMQALIRDLLAYAQVGSKATKYESVDLSELVPGARDRALENLDHPEANVEIGELPTIRGHPNQFDQAFEALLENAIRFTDSPPSNVEVHGRREGQRWHVVVEDDGIGIEPAYHQRVLQLFERLNARADYPGTGIGLAYCKKIVENHGGRVWIESRGGVDGKPREEVEEVEDLWPPDPPLGTRVHIELPIEAPT